MKPECKYCLSESKVTQKQLDSLEKILDKAFARLGIDINFTKHFFDRINDPRNKEQITPKEIALLFKKEYVKFGKPISKLPPGSEAVMKDMESDINVPFVIKYDEKNKEIDLVAKTVMRKKNFTTPDKTYPVESVQLEEGAALSKGASAWIKRQRPVKEEMTSTASIPNPAKTAQGPKFKAHNVTDRRRRKDKNPVVLKRFRKYMEDNA
jgi:hypothetical protein